MAKMNLRRLKAMNTDTQSEKHEWKTDRPGYTSPLTKDLIKASKAAAKMRKAHKALGRKFSKRK